MTQASDSIVTIPLSASFNNLIWKQLVLLLVTHHFFIFSSVDFYSDPDNELEDIPTLQSVITFKKSIFSSALQLAEFFHLWSVTVALHFFLQGANTGV